MIFVLSNKSDGFLSIDSRTLQLLLSVRLPEVPLEIGGMAVGLFTALARVSAVFLDVLHVLGLVIDMLEGEVPTQIELHTEAYAALFAPIWLVGDHCHSINGGIDKS